MSRPSDDAAADLLSAVALWGNRGALVLFGLGTIVQLVALLLVTPDARGAIYFPMALGALAFVAALVTEVRRWRRRSSTGA